MPDLRTRRAPPAADPRRRDRAPPPDATELRNVTVLFADVFRSTDAVLRLDPDEARDYLDGPVETMLAGVRKFGGDIGNIQGDGIMAVFGASAATEDHALRACLAAMEIRDAFARVAPFPGVPPTQLRLGIHSGGASTRRKSGGLAEFDAIGAVVHVASKIEAVCPPGSVCVSSAALKLVRGYVRARPRAPLALGDGEPALPIEELLEVSPDYRLEHYFQNRRPSPLVGREAELEGLRQALQPAAPAPAVIGLVGEAGMGKSRLCYEAQALAEKAGYRIAEVRGASLNSATPFAPLAGCLEPFLLLDTTQREEQVIAQLREHGLSPLEVEAVASVFGVSDAAGAWGELSGGARNKAIVDGVAKTLRALAQRRPLLVIVEDLHDVDHETRACLRRAAELLAGAQCCMLITARPEGAEAVAEICKGVFRLEALSREQSRQLVQNELSGGGEMSPELVEDVLERGNGNPFVLEELLRAVGAPNSRGIGGVPMSIEILIRSRVDKLPGDARRLLHLASVLGMRFPALTLRGIAGIDSRSFERALRDLVRGRFVVADSGLQVEFLHQITRVACYEGIPRGQRARLHQAVLAAAAHDRRRLALSFEALADHAYRAGELDAALDHLWEACRESIASSAVRSVAELRRRALAICEELGSSAAARIVDFELLSFDALQQLGAFREVVGSLESALAFAEAAGAERQICQARGHLATTYWALGRYGAAHRLATSALAQALQARDMPLASYAQFILGCIEFNRGRPREAVRLEGELIAQLGGKLERARFGAVAVMSVMGRAFRCWFLSDLGEFDEAQRMSAVALRVADAMQQPYSQTLACAGEGYRLTLLGRAEAACAPLDKAYEICKASSFVGLVVTVAGWYAQALFASQQYEAARRIVQRTLDFELEMSGYVPAKARIYDVHARLLARDGLGQAALEAADQAVRFVWETHDPLHYAYAVYGRGAVKAAVGVGPEAVRRDYRWALRRAERLGMRPLEALCRSALHELG